MKRPEFLAIISGWTLVDGIEPLTDRLEEVAKFAKENPLTPEEEKYVELMIQCQIARGIERGDFW